ncbi:MAG TPA: tryptophan synthase subunit alpha [Pyrinomonadaceae bacterium]|jgi:tryptophan synthase alpha chain|nr:tryptophan synthase subunit alpha [Pyrinomonadaceae bacterium]
MSGIAETFASLQEAGRKGFIPFVTAGDPDLETSLAICLKLAELGADIIELGVPFSDPMADGPTIQRSSQRALENGMTLKDVLRLAKSFRDASEVPIVLFSYFNPIMAYGLDRFTTDAQAAGIDGLLLTDVIDVEAATMSQKLAGHAIDLISLVAPTTTDDRLRMICGHARGFIYAVSRIGVTGAQADVSDAAQMLVDRTRKFTDLPIAVGFGISTAEQITDVWRFADAAVVGSAIVAEIEGAKSPNMAIGAVQEFVSRLLPGFAKAKAEI